MFERVQAGRRNRRAYAAVLFVTTAAAAIGLIGFGGAGAVEPAQCGSIQARYVNATDPTVAEALARILVAVGCTVPVTTTSSTAATTTTSTSTTTTTSTSTTTTTTTTIPTTTTLRTVPGVCELLTGYYLNQGATDPIVATNIAIALRNAGCTVPSTTSTSTSTTTIFG